MLSGDIHTCMHTVTSSSCPPVLLMVTMTLDRSSSLRAMVVSVRLNTPRALSF